MEEAYRNHLKNINDNDSLIIDLKHEYQIAIKLMYNEYTKKEVCWDIYQCAPSHCELTHWHKNWSKYAKHITFYAFSDSGNVILSQNRENLAHWWEVEDREPDTQEGQIPLTQRSFLMFLKQKIS